MGEIRLKHGKITELAKFCRVSEVTIRSALNEKTHSKLAGKIRMIALQWGGVEVKQESQPVEPMGSVGTGSCTPLI